VVRLVWASVRECHLTRLPTFRGTPVRGGIYEVGVGTIVSEAFTNLCPSQRSRTLSILLQQQTLSPSTWYGRSSASRPRLPRNVVSHRSARKIRHVEAPGVAGAGHLHRRPRAAGNRARGRDRLRWLHRHPVRRRRRDRGRRVRPKTARRSASTTKPGARRSVLGGTMNSARRGGTA
jgi:hypothetical protein